MTDTLTKLRPDRDLQCYFRRPSGIAALSQTGPQDFTVSGTWREQFDWAVVEWNRDNTFEHPALRNLPDGDLSGLHLSYEEARFNCIPLDSRLYPTVDWPFLRVWADPGAGEEVYKVKLLDFATPIGGAYVPAAATFSLAGTLTAGDAIELAWETEHYNYTLLQTDTPQSAVAALAGIINSLPATLSAVATGSEIILTTKDSRLGAAGNLLGVYGSVSGGGAESWTPVWQQLSGGQSPDRWRIDLDFSALKDYTHNPAGDPVPMNAVRKMRWTYAANLQTASFTRCEFAAIVSNWSVTGSALTYSVAGLGSRRIEDDSVDIACTGAWTTSRGNFSGGSIRFTTDDNASLTCSYRASQQHQLYLGTRRTFNGSHITVAIDGLPAQSLNLLIAAEDVLTRVPLGTLDGQRTHTIRITNHGPPSAYFYFDFLEIAIPAEALPSFGVDVKATLATDWDTDHSIALAPERTAWLISKLGFLGRANHYAGALWFYEMNRVGQIYASIAIDFVGAPARDFISTVSIDGSVLDHVHLAGDTALTVAKAFELRINNGFTGVWAKAAGAVLTITARAMGVTGNGIPLVVTTNQHAPAPAFAVNIAGGSATLTGGFDGIPANVGHMDDAASMGWRTDLTAVPRINRAARDWSRSFFAALKTYGITVTAAFSTELQHGDPSVETGIVQRYHSGNPVVLNTPAQQTNFSPVSVLYWRHVYLEMAQIMIESGQLPYLQFGEVQWWYFADDGSSLPFYDDFTQTQFSAAYNRPLSLIATNTANPASFPQEAAFLPSLIGSFTNQIIEFIRQTYPNTRFEVLYAPDVNDFPFTRIVNFPHDAWTPAILDCLKTENFSYTYARNLDKGLESVLMPMALGFPRSKSSHLVGISDYTTPWEKETGLAMAQNVESVVLFALDQFCLNGYPVPFRRSDGRSLFMG